MLYRFGSTRNPSDQYLRVYSEHAATLADCGALHRIQRWRFVAIVDEKEKSFSGSMIGLRRTRLCASALVCVFRVCAVAVSVNAMRGVALRSPQQAPAGRGNGRAARWRRGLSIRVPAYYSYLCEKMRVAGEGRREAFECAVLFCLMGTYVTVAARGNADRQRRRRSTVRRVVTP
ncbi:hypothetical protein [Burkholderia ambifaria]|uniref:hypothetical protein n=1 Tax=Burkholderia ambifaria TaxID=152480 RepID=UPI00158F612A|nr:hypothetical protein [Burkholderia ambifaria]